MSLLFHWVSWLLVRTKRLYFLKKDTYHYYYFQDGHITPANPLFTVQELKKQLVMSKTRFVIAHPLNLDTVLEAAELSSIPIENIWSIFDDPKKRVNSWKEILLQDGKEANSVSFSLEESKYMPAYICFSSGTTGIYYISR